MLTPTARISVAAFALALAFLPARGAASLPDASHPPRAIVLGFDGLDARLVRDGIRRGELPNLAALLSRPDESGAPALRPTTPPESPVSWASIATGAGPGSTGIYGFVRRDPRTYRLHNGLVDIRKGRFLTQRIPLTRTKIVNRRRGDSFWEIAAGHGLATIALTTPVSFPPRRTPNLRELPGLGVGDILGTQGTYQYFTTRSDEVPPSGESLFGGRIRHISPSAEDRFDLSLAGPAAPTRSEGTASTRNASTQRLRLTVTDEGRATIELVNGSQTSGRLDLIAGVWSPLVPLRFRLAGGFQAHARVRLLLVRASHAGTATDVALYVSPLHIDPSDPLIPLTSPPDWSHALAQSYGPFKTAGLASELWGRGDSFIGDGAFLTELEETRTAWEARLLNQLKNDDWRLVVAVDQFSDHVGHFFFSREPERVLAYYRTVDALVGTVLRDFVDARTLLLVVSDHGMGRFDTELHLNRWLEREGYLALTTRGTEVHRELGAFYRDEISLDGIDWSRTRAYAAGLGGIYLNVRGREAQGIVSPGPEAEALKLRLREALLALRPPSGSEPVVLAVHDGAVIYPESVPGEAPDLVVGLRDGFRVSWSTALGGVARDVFEPNVGAWGADHCSLDARVVPGVLLANRPIETDSPTVLDIAPTVLSFLGIPSPNSMRGRDLLATEGPVAARRLP